MELGAGENVNRKFANSTQMDTSKFKLGGEFDQKN